MYRVCVCVCVVLSWCTLVWWSDLRLMLLCGLLSVPGAIILRV